MILTAIWYTLYPSINGCQPLVYEDHYYIICSINVGKAITIINNPRVITIDSWDFHHSQSCVVYYCYTHTSYLTMLE